MQSDYPQPQFLSFQDRRLAYYRFDPSSGRARDDAAPLLWLHANGYAGLTYTPLLRKIADAGYTVYTLDFAGHGNSDEPAGAFDDWFYFRDQALTLLAHLKLDRVRLIGHSLGGASSLLAAAALQDSSPACSPSQAAAISGGAGDPGGARNTKESGAARTVVESLCLLDPTVFTPFLVQLLRFLPNPMAKAAENRRRVFKSLKIVARSYRMHPAFMNWRQDVYDAYLRYALRLRDDGQYELVLPPAIEARIFRTLRAGHWKYHKSVTTPALVIQAANGQVCPDRARRILTRNHPESRGLRHESGSHFFPMEFPDWTADRILEFIAST
ncbi:MAG: alpha/beta hydrolase [bacterium]|nr:alpha/beta hydrolase [bacterium]